MLVEQFIETVTHKIRKMFGKDKRFAEYIKKDPDVKVSYKNGRLIVDQLSWPCDGGWGALVVMKNKIRYDQERSSKTILSYNNWSLFMDEENNNV